MKSPARSRAATRRWAQERATRPPPRPRPSRGSSSAAIAQNSERTCECDGCHQPRHEQSKWCRSHKAHYRNTGHPEARHLRRADWKPYVVMAERFVREQLRGDHPAILAGLRWISDELTKAENPAEHSVAYLHYAEALIRAGNHGVDPTTFLARWIAGYLADNRGREAGPFFASDEHAAAQIARLYLLPKPFGDQKGQWVRRKLVEQPAIVSSRLSLATRSFTYERVNAALGMLALKASEEILRRQADHL